MNNRPLIVLFWLWLALPALSGCVVVAAGAGAGTVAYAKGKMTVAEQAEYPRAWRAALKGTRDAGLSIINSSDYGNHGLIVARTGEDKRVTIKVDRLNAQKTQIEIRVGNFGDQDLSLLIYNRIKANL
jgi:hypothetical protein